MPPDSTAPLIADPIHQIHTDAQGQLLGVGDSGVVYVRTLLNGRSVWVLYMAAPMVSRHA